MFAFLAILVTSAGTLAILGCNALGTTFFRRKPPRGEHAVGLITVFPALLVACGLVAFGSVFASLADNRAIGSLLGTRGWANGILTIAVTIGIAIAAFMAFLAWCESGSAGVRARTVTFVICWLAGILGPVLLATMLIVDVSMSPQALRGQPMLLAGARWGCGMLGGVAALGYLATGFALWPRVKYNYYRHRHLASSFVRFVKRLRLPRDLLLQELRKELDLLPAGAPIADTLAYFNDPVVKRNSDCLALVTQRVLAHPDRDDHFCKAMRAGSLRERWSGFEFVRLASLELLAAHEAAWSEAVRHGIICTAEEMDRTPMLMLDFDLKRDPPGFVKSLIGAADRFRGSAHYESIADGLRQLARGADGLRQDKHKAKVARILMRAGYPIPEPQRASER